MSAGQRMERRYSTDRMIAFSDGVVAIAITLLILPLADIDIPKTPEAENNPLLYVWHTYQGLITSFLISWIVIVIFWLGHNRIFSLMASLNVSIVRWNILWLFAVVVFPFPTNLLSQTGYTNAGLREVTAFYIGNMLVISLALTLISRELTVNPELVKTETVPNPIAAAVGTAMTSYIAVLFVVALLWPTAALYGLMGLAFIGPATSAVYRRRQPAPVR